MQRSDPHFARGLQTGRPRQPREYQRRRGPAWALLALSLAMLVMGMVLPQGLLLATGLVSAGMALCLLAPPYDPDRPDLPLHAAAQARLYRYGPQPTANIATTLVARGEFALILAAEPATPRPPSHTPTRHRTRPRPPRPAGDITPSASSAPSAEAER